MIIVIILFILLIGLCTIASTYSIIIEVTNNNGQNEIINNLNINKDDVNNKGKAEVIIAKHRNGPTGVVELYFKDECTKFLNLNNDTGEPLDEVNQQATSRSKEVEGLEDLPVNVEENLQATVKSVDDEIF